MCHMSQYVPCTIIHPCSSQTHASVLLLVLSQSLAAVHAWWQFPLHVVEGRWCTCTGAAEDLSKTFQEHTWRHQCKNPNVSSAFDFLLRPWLSDNVPAFQSVQDPSARALMNINFCKALRRRKMKYYFPCGCTAGLVEESWASQQKCNQWLLQHCKQVLQEGPRKYIQEELRASGNMS